jgi:uncharacterized protein (TIGR00730 family)
MIEDVRDRLKGLLEEYVALDAELRKLEDTEFRVCIFGSARIRPEDPTYQIIYRLAKSLAGLGVDIVTGGGPGLMEAANRGVQEARNEQSKSYGLPIELPRSLETPNKHLDIKSQHKRFSSRLDEFMRLSHAVIVAPGGIGTLLELMYVWQLLQVGMIERRPLILLDRGFWSGLIAWMRNQPLRKGFIGAHDLDHVHLVDSPKEVVKVIRAAVEAYKRSHELTVEEMPEEQRGPVAGHFMRAAVEQAAVAAPEAVSAAAPEAIEPAIPEPATEDKDERPKGPEGL